MSAKDMRMYPVKNDDDVYQFKREFKEPLQKPPFVYCYAGSRGTGKTNALINEMLMPWGYANNKGQEPVFEDMYIFSSTLGCDSTSRFLVQKATMCFNTYDDSMIEMILDSQKAKEKKDRRHILIVCDDFGAGLLKPTASIFKLCSVHRHYLISICFLYQSMRMCPPVVRSCMTALHLYRIPNAKEQEKAFEDLSFMGSKNMIQDLYDYSTDKPYQFLYIDCIKMKAYKWGATQPEFLWEKYNDSGGYNEPFVNNNRLSKKQRREKEKQKALEDLQNSDDE
jgi:hypothetical protein